MTILTARHASIAMMVVVSLSLLLLSMSVTAKSEKDKLPTAVSCPFGPGIGYSLEKGVKNLLISGTCTEDVEITGDDVTLMRGGTFATVSGTITILGAHRVTISGITVTGSGKGVVATENAAVTLENVIVENNADVGVEASLGASIKLTGTTVRGSGSTAAQASDQAVIWIQENNTLQSSLGGIDGPVVGAYRNATVLIRGDNNSLENTTGSGRAIDIGWGSTFRQDRGHAVIDGSIEAFSLSSVSIRDAEITGNISVGQLSQLRLSEQGIGANTVVNGNISGLSGTHIIRFIGGAGTIQVNGSISCSADTELLGRSSANVTGTTTPGC